MKKYKEKILIEEVYKIFNQKPKVNFIAPNNISFELMEVNLTAMKLFKLCKLFDTENIEIINKTRKYLGCYSTCDLTESYLLFSVKPTPEESNERLYNKINYEI